MTRLTGALTFLGHLLNVPFETLVLGLPVHDIPTESWKMDTDGKATISDRACRIVSVRLTNDSHGSVLGDLVLN